MGTDRWTDTVGSAALSARRSKSSAVYSVGGEAGGGGTAGEGGITGRYVPKPRTPSASATRLRYSVSLVRGRVGGVGSSVITALSLLKERSYRVD